MFDLDTPVKPEYDIKKNGLGMTEWKLEDDRKEKSPRKKKCGPKNFAI